MTALAAGRYSAAWIIGCNAPDALFGPAQLSVSGDGITPVTLHTVTGTLWHF